uniref:Acetate--CoA ligase n=1 Tax=uncultured gamma proteobacterium HF0010_11K06 TaxID=710980 RepID=E0XQV8_9GAMM|nr:acyl-coenzyme A synthetases/AMP-(fatty) acid ligases [uncultured gamma proteobacterium HF0010_11K06]
MKTYSVSEEKKKNSIISEEDFNAEYQESINNPESFWQKKAEETLDWFSNWDEVAASDLEAGEVAWFKTGKLNACFNCVDRHLEIHANKTAIIWEGDDPNDNKEISFQKLHKYVCQFANLLKSRNIKKGDRVCIYMPMIPEAAYAMLACARIGAIHSVVFGGFSIESLKDRILDSDCTAVITANEGVRGGKLVPLKNNVDEALKDCPNVHSVIVVNRTKSALIKENEVDVDYYQNIEEFDADCPCEEMNAEDPLFILYTSGSTGKPKGVLHTTGGYLLGAALSHKYIFNIKEDSIYWCTADVGWVTGHTYIVYGPLANASTTLMFEGIPTFPDVSRFWNVIDKHQVNIFYTAPTAIRALMAHGNEPLQSSSRDSLEVLGTVGEPINPEAWEWYYHEVGKGKCPIVDTWWQTETGSIMISGLAGFSDQKPGCAGKPFLGINPALVDEEGDEIEGPGKGNLVVKSSWPSQIRTVYGDHQRCVETYYSTYKGFYFTGDGAERDADDFYRITGRVDDVLNVSGHRLGTAEIESALVLHEAVAEAAVVGFEHEIKGQGIYCYVNLMKEAQASDAIHQELIGLIVKEIGPIAKPDSIQFCYDLPKTRSGKIMRRILRKIAENELDNLGDTTTLADPSIVDILIKERLNK